MNALEKAEQYLLEYRDCKKAINNLKKVIAYKMGGPKYITAISYEASGVSVRMVQNTMETLEELRILSEQLQGAQEWVRIVEDALESMDDPLSKTLLEMYYITEMTQERIGMQLNYSHQHIDRLLSKALERFARSLFGHVQNRCGDGTESVIQ